MGSDANDWLLAGVRPLRVDVPADDGEPVDTDVDERTAHLPYVLFRDVRPILASQWLIKGVLPRHGLAAIYGPSGEGKTFIALDLLMSIAGGAAWRGHRTTPGAVLYLAPDGGALVQNRLAAYRQHHGITGDCDFVLVPCPVDLLGKLGAGDVARVTDLIAHIESTYGLKIVAVCVDTVSRAMPGGDENQPADMTRFIDNLAKIQNGADRLLVGIHHTPKSDAATMRGHSSLHGACDCELNVADRKIRIAKQRDGADGAEFGFDLAVVELGRDEDGDPVTSCVAVRSDGDRKPKKKLSDRDKLALETLRDLVITEGEKLPQGTRYPGAGQHLGVELSRYRNSLYEKAFSGTDRDTFKKVFQRIRERLQAAGLIGIYGDLVWLPGHRDSGGTV